jgi:L-cysteine S-thiosulfotransferase
METALPRRFFRWAPRLVLGSERRSSSRAATLILYGLSPLIAGGAAAVDQNVSAEVTLQVVGDGIPRPLPGAAAGNAERGRALLVERGNANCVLCHAFPDPALRVAGDIGPSLAGVGRKLSPAQLRLRIADIQRLTPNAAMPSYYRVDALDRVAAAYRGKPVLDAQQVEDLVAYLETLR